MADHHPHDDEHHSRRPEWWNGISLGNVLTVLAMALAGVGSYAASESRITKLETEHVALEKNVASASVTDREMIAELKAANEKLDAKIEKVDDKLDQILLRLNVRPPQ